MDVRTLNTHPSTCPVCNRTGVFRQGKLSSGLIVCQYCQERLVVSWSGHYVRDPFTYKMQDSEKALRQQSRPWARFFRDVNVMRRSSILMALGGTLIIGVVLSMSGGFLSLQNPLQNFWEPSERQTVPVPPRG